MIEQDNKELFTQYISNYPFWNDFLYSNFQELYSNPKNSAFVAGRAPEAFMNLRLWYGNPANLQVIEEIKTQLSKKASTLKNNDFQGFIDQQKNLKAKIPSLRDLNTYIGMFDEG